MRDKADVFFNKKYYKFIEQVKITKTTEEAMQYAIELASALYPKRDRYDSNMRFTKCIQESLLSLEMLTSQQPEAHQHFVQLYNDETKTKELVNTLQNIVHKHKKS